MPEFTPQLIVTIVAAMIAGAAVLAGLVALMRSKAVQSIEESAEQRGARLITEGLEHLADKTAQVQQKADAAKASADADRVMAMKDQILRDAIASIQSKL